MDTYRVPSQDAESEFVEKKSRFIGRIWVTETEEEAIEHIKAMRQQHWDATHNVYAYVIHGGATRYSDDGEPQGTGGMPCLEVLKNAGLTDVVVTVTRYFGGILLGAPGLVRAYTKAAAEAVAAAQKVTMTECRRVASRYDYSYHGRVSTLAASAGKLDGTDFSDKVALACFVRSENVEKYVAAVTEATNGTAETEVSELAEFIAL